MALNNPESDKRNYSQKYYEKNKEYIKAKSREYYEKNRESKIHSSQSYYTKNREAIRNKYYEKKNNIYPDCPFSSLGLALD